MKIAGANEPPIHIKILLTAGSFCQTWRTHKTLNFNDIRLLFHQQNLGGILFSHRFHHPVFGRLNFEMIYELSVVVIDEFHPGVGHRLS